MLDRITSPGSLLSLSPQEAFHLESSLTVGSFITLLGASIGGLIGTLAFDDRGHRCGSSCERVGLDKYAKLEKKDWLGGGLYRLEYSFSTPEKKREYEEYMEKHRGDLEKYLEQTKNDHLQYVKTGALAGAVCGVAFSLFCTIGHWPIDQ